MHKTLCFPLIWTDKDGSTLPSEQERGLLHTSLPGSVPTALKMSYCPRRPLFIKGELRCRRRGVPVTYGFVFSFAPTRTDTHQASSGAPQVAFVFPTPGPPGACRILCLSWSFSFVNKKLKILSTQHSAESTRTEPACVKPETSSPQPRDPPRYGGLRLARAAAGFVLTTPGR